MIGFPNAKINLGLNITDKLPNGYHILKSLMIPVKFCDIIEFLPAEKDSLKITGREVPGNTEDNILWKVLALLREKHKISPLTIHLHKSIPAGAGLGGGSSDAAFFLNMLNEFFNLNITVAEREDLIAEVGSDCPFFIRNKPAIISGTGTILSPFDMEFSNIYIGIAFPGYEISTAKAYSRVQVKPEKMPLEDLLVNGFDQWRNKIENDFEHSLFPEFPDLASLKQEFYNCGATYASLSGSGSAVYGLFKEKPAFSPELEEKLVYQGMVF